MRKIILLIGMIFVITSMTAQSPEKKIFKDGYVAIYESPPMGEMRQNYIILTATNDSFEIISFAWNGIIFGKFEIANDTLRLNQQYEFLRKMKEIDSSEISISSIPLLFKIKDDELVDITSYEKYPEIAVIFYNIEDYKGTVYKKVKLQGNYK